ncbi:hypothetical protein AB4090_14720 [Acidithiobacillus sp. IBUN Pt1247-S3]|uniref:hypothetical protein n=1 Tax=Acidithiobacillus sp. IBUN Pt1247-S3 TaxID=3166642 RepID=UPI0034E4D23D
MTEKQRRQRRTKEELLAELEKKRLEIMEKQQAKLAKLEEEAARLARSPAARKTEAELQKQFERSVKALTPHWNPRHFIAAIHEALQRYGEEAEELAEKGKALLTEHGKNKRGRRPKSG